MKHVRRLSILFLSALFLYAGIDKAVHYDGFINALNGYVLIPRGFGPSLALPLILCELLVGVGLLVKPWRSAAALLASGLLMMFTAAIAVNQHYAPGTVCGCWFTITLGEATATHVLQNLVLLGLAASVWLNERGLGSERFRDVETSRV
jgi:putative oxidoreductase